MNRRKFMSIPILGLPPLSIAPVVTAVDAEKVTEWVGMDVSSVDLYGDGLVTFSRPAREQAGLNDLGETSKWITLNITKC